jgi:hypothetical protein
MPFVGSYSVGQHWYRINKESDKRSKKPTQIFQVILVDREPTIIAPIWRSRVHFHEDFLQPNYLLEVQVSVETMK